MKYAAVLPVLLAGAAVAQPLDNGDPTIFLPRDGGNGTTPMEVGYHPGFDRYYASNGGNPNFSVWTYDASGELVSGPTAAGADVRSINYNSNTGDIEVVQFSNNELRIASLDGSGNWVDASPSAGVIIEKPDSQSMPAYDAANDQFYAYPSSGSNTVSIISREFGGITGTITLDLAAAGIGANNLNSWSCGYLEDQGWLIVFDAVNDDAVVFDLSGNYLGTSSLATNIEPSFRNGSANGQVFVFDSSRNGWQGYSLGGGGCNDPDGCGDWDGDGDSDADDFFGFLDDFANGANCADIDGDEDTDADDFFAFLDAFVNPC